MKELVIGNFGNANASPASGNNAVPASYKAENQITNHKFQITNGDSRSTTIPISARGPAF
jgi:hypothetical protein